MVYTRGGGKLAEHHVFELGSIVLAGGCLWRALGGETTHDACDGAGRALVPARTGSGFRSQPKSIPMSS